MNCIRREEVGLFKSMHLERLYNMLIVNVLISDLVSVLQCVRVCCLFDLLCSFLLAFVCGSAKRTKVDLNLHETHLLQAVSKIPSAIWAFIGLGAIALIKTRFYHPIG